MSDAPLTRVMFVCMGNICRSPLAEGVFRHVAQEMNVFDHYEVASSGTGAWHVGQKPDRRMRETAMRHGVSLEEQRAQQFEFGDLSYYDVILTMDSDNLSNIKHLDRHGKYADKIKLFRSYDPEPGDLQVPDPYYGGEQGFEHVYQIVDRTVRKLLQDLESRTGS